jgi:aldehyde:ferredoxin oxidoreductase
MVPIRNWQRCGIDPKFDELIHKWYDKWGTKREACFTCPVHCHASYAVNDGKYPCRGGGPEYETMTALGHKCDVTDGRTVLKANSMCNDYGLDTVETGNLFSTVMELRERGLIDSKYTDGVDLTFGNGDAIIELLPKLVFRKDCGKKLALGPYRLARTLGKKALQSVYHQKGMGPTGVELRSTVGACLSFCLSPRGAHHLSGLPTAEWVNIPPIAVHVSGYKEAGELLSYHTKAKANLVQYYENLFFMADSLGICKFNFGHLPYWHDSPENLEYMYEQVTKAIYCATGIKYTKEELFNIFEKAYQIERASITMRGMRRKDDMPTYKATAEPCPGDHPVNPIPLPPIDLEKYNKVLDAYYEVRGWDKETGIPKAEHLNKLGLEEVAAKITLI